MYPLLEIKSVPIEIQMKTKGASLEYSRGSVEMEISRSEGGGVDVKSRPIQLRMDTFESSGGRSARAVTAPPSAPAYEATGAYTDGGQLTVNARLGNQTAVPPQSQAVSAQAYQTQTPAQTASAQGAGAGTNVEWNDGSMEIRYGMDKLNFDWKIEKGEFKFTPGDIEITVAQRPSITIKYLGDPIYVPKSADPNYKPVDVQA